MLQVIGDSSGLTTSVKLQESFAILEELQAIVGIPVKFVHLISNPFDSIALNLMRGLDSSIKVRGISMVCGDILSSSFTLLK